MKCTSKADCKHRAKANIENHDRTIIQGILSKNEQTDGMVAIQLLTNAAQWQQKDNDKSEHAPVPNFAW